MIERRRRLLKRDRAVSDLEEIAVQLGREAGHAVSLRFLIAADAALRRLREFPQIGSTRGELTKRFPSIRMWPIPEFPEVLVFYQLTERGIEIVRVLHGARDIDSVFDE